MSLAVNPQTHTALTAMQQAHPHGILLYGDEGVGLRTITREYFESKAVPTFTVLPEKNEVTDIEKGTITVESIRRLYDTVKTVTETGRLIVIDYAERMGIPAQNAFLKLLEEPPAKTQFVLLTHTPDTLLPTIWSRVQSVEVKKVSNEATGALLDSLSVTDATKRAQLTFIAKGLPAEITRLAQDETLFSQRAEIVKDARLFVTGLAYDRLVLAKKYKDSRSNALVLLQDASRQVATTIAQNGSERMLTTLAAIERTHVRIVEQGNVRLQLSSLVVL